MKNSLTKMVITMMVIVLVVSALPVTTMAQERSDEVTALRIRNIDDWILFTNNVKNGNTYEGKTVKLVADLDFNTAEPPVINSFKGVFDGCNHTISNFTLYGDSLFGKNYGTVENLVIEGMTSATGGTLIERNYGRIDNCRMRNCAFLGDNACLVLHNEYDGVISNCICDIGDASQGCRGIVGAGYDDWGNNDWNRGKIINCAVWGTNSKGGGTIVAGSNGYGGEIAYCYTTIPDSSFYGDYNGGTIKRSYAPSLISDDILTGGFTLEEMSTEKFVKALNAPLITEKSLLNWELDPKYKYPVHKSVNEVCFKKVSKGYITTDRSYASHGQTVKLSVYPNSGYEISSISSKDVSIKKKKKNLYSFTMPNKTVTISASMKKKSSSGSSKKTTKKRKPQKR